MLIALSSEITPDISRVGGKAASLIRLTAEGHNVPRGAVLTAEFFQPWFDALQESSYWQEVVSSIASSEDLAVLHAKCEHVKSEAVQLDLNPLQAAKIGELKAMFPDDNSSCAIRSSSPEEDLVGASFAGQYETILDVLPEHFELSIRACFVSSLDARVMLLSLIHI